MSDEKKPFATVEVATEIDEQTARDLLCSAWEGGSNYWCQVRGWRYAHDAAKRAAKQIEFAHERPFLPGVTVVLTDATGEGGPKEPWELNREKLIAGLQVMATKYPKHFLNVLQENADAETGDVYLQCCLFGDIVFG